MNSSPPLLIGALLAAATSVIVIAFARHPVFARVFADIPNDRSLHSVPVPRVGGFGIMLGIAVAVFAIGWQQAPAPAVAIALGLAVVSMLDDVRSLPVAVRLCAHVLAAAGLVAVYLTGWPWWFLALAVLTLVWVTNLYNFMDGSDGLAGGMTAIGFAAYALAAWSGGAPALAAVAASIAAAALGFLAFNFPPARVFLGDAGSVPLGFLAAALGVVGFASGIWPVWFPAIVFSPFIADASVTLLRRLARGERLSQAHKSHYYQRAIRLGYSHRTVALAAYLLMAGMSALALATMGTSRLVQAMALVAALALYAALFGSIDRAWRRATPDGTLR